jgi:hypothetical protein
MSARRRISSFAVSSNFPDIIFFLFLLNAFDGIPGYREGA